MKALLAFTCGLVLSCAALRDDTVIDPDTGRTAGEQSQDNIATSIGGIVTTASQNAGLGIGAAALTAMILGRVFGRRA